MWLVPSSEYRYDVRAHHGHHGVTRPWPHGTPVRKGRTHPTTYGGFALIWSHESSLLCKVGSIKTNQLIFTHKEAQLIWVFVHGSQDPFLIYTHVVHEGLNFGRPSTSCHVCKLIQSWRNKTKSELVGFDLPRGDGSTQWETFEGGPLPEYGQHPLLGHTSRTKTSSRRRP